MNTLTHGLQASSFHSTVDDDESAGAVGVRFSTVRADELGPEELRSGAKDVERKIARWRPRVVAVVGLSAYRTAFSRPRATVGRQGDHVIHGAEMWALPNPSGLNAHYPTAELAKMYRAAAEAAGVVPK